MARLVDESVFQEWDGRSVDLFREVAAGLRPTTENTESLVQLVDEASEPAQVGATWILKHWLEQKAVDPTPVQDELIDLVSVEVATDARLHLLQILPHLTIAAAKEARLFRACKKLTEHQNKFVRAWTFNGLGLVARQNVKYRREVEPLFQRAEEAEPASVKARIRNIRKAWERG